MLYIKRVKPLAHVLLDRQSNQGKNIIIPRVGEDIDSFAFEKKMLKDKGYTVGVNVYECYT